MQFLFIFKQFCSIDKLNCLIRTVQVRKQTQNWCSLCQKLQFCACLLSQHCMLNLC